jgi:uncharacterized protein (DUF433 family)
MSYISERITIDENICGGKPTIRGKRITVQTVLEFLSAGETLELCIGKQSHNNY